MASWGAVPGLTVWFDWLLTAGSFSLLWEVGETEEPGHFACLSNLPMWRQFKWGKPGHCAGYRPQRERGREKGLYFNKTKEPLHPLSKSCSVSVATNCLLCCEIRVLGVLEEFLTCQSLLCVHRVRAEQTLCKLHFSAVLSFHTRDQWMWNKW